MKVQINEIKFNYPKEAVIHDGKNIAYSFKDNGVTHVTVNFKIEKLNIFLTGFTELSIEQYRSNIDNLEGLIKNTLMKES